MFAPPLPCRPFLNISVFLYVFFVSILVYFVGVATPRPPTPTATLLSLPIGLAFSYCNFSWKETTRASGRESEEVGFLEQANCACVWFNGQGFSLLLLSLVFPLLYLFISLEFSQQFVWFDCAWWEMSERNWKAANREEEERTIEGSFVPNSNLGNFSECTAKSSGYI